MRPGEACRTRFQLERRPVIGCVFAAARVVGALDAIELRDAVGFAFPNPALHTVLLVFTAAELAFNLKMSALGKREGEFAKLRPGDDAMPVATCSPSNGIKWCGSPYR